MQSKKFQTPSNKKKVRKFFGMLNILSKYVFKMQLTQNHSKTTLDNRKILNGQQNIRNDAKKKKLFSLKDYQTLF